MITEVTFVQMVCIGRTNTRDTRFRHADGWRIALDGDAVQLKQEDGSMAFGVRGVGFTYVQIPDEDYVDGELATKRLREMKKGKAK